MIGEGAKSKSLKLLAKKLKVPSSCLKFLNPMPLELVPTIYKSANLSIVAIDGPSAKSSLPSKTFTSLMCGTPIYVLAPLESDLAKIVQKYNCGIITEINNQSEIKVTEIINSISKNYEYFEKMSLNALSASKFFTEKNSDKLVEKIL